jgi:beta-glucosidase-like glycosyl hydrolase
MLCVTVICLVPRANAASLSYRWEGEQCVGQAGSIPRLGLRSMCMQDSPVGVRDTDYNSVFPGGVTAAATWDRDLIYARALAMGQEHHDKGVTVQLGPVCGPIGRAPEGGRNWEGFAPDPVLSGIAVAESVKGIQDAGVVACVKHFIGYEQGQSPLSFYLM